MGLCGAGTEYGRGTSARYLKPRKYLQIPGGTVIQTDMWEGRSKGVTLALQQIEVNAGEQSVIVLINNQGPVLPAVDLGVCVTIRSVYVSQRRMMLESKKIAWVCR